MRTQTITFFETSGWQKIYLKQRLSQHKLNFFSDPISLKALNKIKDTTILAVFVGSSVTAEVINALPNLKFIVTLSTGYDHIDLTACKQRKIQVANVPYYGEHTVAEHAFALLLSISRKIHQSYERTNRGNFSFEGLQGFDLKGKTMGVIGTGHIGEHVIRMAKGFELKVLAFDVHPNKRLARKMGFQYVSLETLLRQSDIITLHVPYLKATHHMLNAAKFKLIKKGAVLINTARGGLIDTSAMVKALQSGKLKAVGLDVLEDEKDIKEEMEFLSPKFTPQNMRLTIENHYLMHSEDAVITPHNAFNTKEAIERILDTTIGNIDLYCRGKKLINRVNL